MEAMDQPSVMEGLRSATTLPVDKDFSCVAAALVRKFRCGIQMYPNRNRPPIHSFFLLSP